MITETAIKKSKITSSDAIADIVKEICKKKGWKTAKPLADYCGVSVRTVEGWLQGRRPSKTALVLIGTLL